MAFQLCVCLLLIKTLPHVLGRILFPIFHCEHVDPFVYHHFSGWWFGTFYIVPYIVNFIIPTDEIIFFKGVSIPPTRYKKMVPKITPYMVRTQDYSILIVPYINGTLYYHHFCWLSPIICWTVTLDRHGHRDRQALPDDPIED